MKIRFICGDKVIMDKFDVPLPRRDDYVLGDDGKNYKVFYVQHRYILDCIIVLLEEHDSAVVEEEKDL